MKHKYLSTFLFSLLLVAISMPAQAQLNNKPFSFKGSPNGNLGMSIGGQQAILNLKVTGLTPRNLLRAGNGELLSLTKGSNGQPIVSYNGGTLPTYKGSSYKAGNKSMSVGAFNAFFVPKNGKSSNYSSADNYSSAVVNTWTARVVSGGAPISYLPNNAVDNWTSLVHTN